MIRSFVLLTILLLNAHVVYGWGGQGHKAIGIVAADLLDGITKQHIKQVLGNTDLAGISTWMDDARALARNQNIHFSPEQKVEARAFNKEFPINAAWHFVDLPLASTSYTPTSLSASPDDVVHAINDAIAVLEGSSTKYSKIQAMRVLVHMVGDVHQPLHVACGYYDVSNLAYPKLITNPALAVGKPDDRGGNQLFYTETLELHAMWDTKMPERIAHTPDAYLLAGELKKYVSISKWTTFGDYHQWAAAWACDSAAEAFKAYQGIKFGAVTMNGDAIGRIDITLPGGTKNYCDAQQTRARTQLAKAGVHLAQLLNAIHWK